ncbi:MAG: carbamoyltransferase HypF, partial [Arenicellales bacterium]|nr:carbamoyltransferase HypF [Arenicellales bacterium]
MPEIVTQKLCVTGQVQGVGFRPFVYRLAKEFGITGWVRNCAGTVEILAQSDTNTLKRFREKLTRSAPPFAVPKLTSFVVTPELHSDTFDILDSEGQTASDIHLPADQFVCSDCLTEMQEPANRRYRYPFINCTQCGPRYTLIDRLPYDRSNTSMADFAMCTKCRNEYRDVSDRRFHAEPIACPHCGPRLVYVNGKSRIIDTESAISAAIDLLLSGGIVAVRGIGGYHLFCDACNEVAVTKLRQRKHRPHKPLAVMAPQLGDDLLDGVRIIVTPRPEQAHLLVSPKRPIVLCDKNQPSPLAENIAPRLNEVGVFLPYSPLHHLILDAFGGPLVATSGNISGEPVLTEETEAEQRLSNIADGFLHHNRDIRRPADDAVFRFSAHGMRPLRLGRGYAPLELRLIGALPKPMLAVGGHMKNTVCLAWRDRVVISPHIGDLDSPRSTRIFQQVVEDLQRVYDTEPELIV